MNWRYLFLSPHGRISRKDWWSGYGVFVLALALMYGVIWLIDFVDYGGVDNGDDALTEPNVIPGIIFSTITAYPVFCFYSKRLHDMGRSGWWVGILVFTSFLYSVTYLLGLIGTASQPNLAGWAIILFSIAIGLIAIVYLGTFVGQKGDNIYGADPLPAAYHERPNQSWLQSIFGLKGRLSRSQYWIGMGASLGVFCAIFLIYTMLFAMALAIRGTPLLSLPEKQMDAAINEFMASGSGLALLIFLAIGFVIYLYNIHMVAMKRLHDRGRSGWWQLLPYILALIGIISFMIWPTSIGFKLITALAAIVTTWLFIETAMLRGSSDHNKYGPSPLYPQKEPAT